MPLHDRLQRPAHARHRRRALHELEHVVGRLRQHAGGLRASCQAADRAAPRAQRLHARAVRRAAGRARADVPAGRARAASPTHSRSWARPAPTRSSSSPARSPSARSERSASVAARRRAPRPSLLPSASWTGFSAPISFCAWRSGVIVTTSHARPTRFISADDHLRRVDLVPLQAVRGGAREGVVVVVPALAEGRDREPEDVGRVILDVEAALAEEVADRVDRPGHVVLEEDAHEAAPDEAGDRALQLQVSRPPSTAGISSDGERRSAGTCG